MTTRRVEALAKQRALPRLDADNRFFWTSGADGVLRFLQCRACSTFVHPPHPICPQCLSEHVAPTAVAGTGVIDTFTINHQQWRRDLEVPYVIARVRIDGAPGVVLTTTIVGSPPHAIDIGDRVRVVFEHDEDIYVPLFEKVE